MRSYSCRFLVCGLALGIGGTMRAGDIDRPPIEYEKSAPADAVSALQARIRAGGAALKRDKEHGYLRSVLTQLDVPLSSQVFVFSRTSLQRGRISPRTPRALYFNDEVAVGFCLNGDVLEVAAADPKLGTTFYTVDQRNEKEGVFTRQTDNCLLCHGSSANQGMPGHIIRSVFPDRVGEPVYRRGTRRVDHTTPFSERWGGWYVTGTSGQQTHLGNKCFNEDDAPPATEGVNVTQLKQHFPVERYLTPHSDLVALMVLEHQAEGHNRLARANLLTRMALYEQTEVNRSFGQPLATKSDSYTRRIEWACEPLVEYLLFGEEAKLSEAIVGTSEFAREFAARGPFDSKRRSLREFDLRTRLFRYPMSYLVYTRAFDGLPIEAKDRVLRRLWEVLTGADTSKPFAHLTAEQRRNILEILRETMPGLPAYWKG